jgi:sodium pump decarboxylase gamma subunit
MDFEALGQAGVLMLVGMVVVFLFLIILIFAINSTTFLARKLKWGESEEPEAVAPTVEPGDDEAAAAVIAATAHHAARG